MRRTTIKVLILLATGFYLYSLIWRGTLEMYIHPRFSLLTLGAAVGFFLVGVSYLRANKKLVHDHGTIPWWGLLIVVLPILLGWLVPPRPLGALAMTTREINLGQIASVVPGGGETLLLASSERNILDWINAFQRVGDPSQFTGEEARLVGFVYRDERFAPDTFMISRFVVSCCTADGTPVGLIVSAPNAADFQSDDWVEVSGRFTTGQFDGQTLAILMADKITPVDLPSQPYLYP